MQAKNIFALLLPKVLILIYGLPNSEVVHRLNTAIDEIGKSSYIIQLLLNDAAVKISLAQEFFLQKNELVDSIISLINDITES